MVGGVDRYYQIARCLRDEDLRADRQFEFTQLDMEASFVDQDDVLGFVTEAVLDAAEAATGERPPPIERMTWADAIDRYGTDKPDLRFGMELLDLSPVFAGTEVRAFAAPCVKALRVEGGATFARSRLDALTDQAKALGAKGLAWFRVNDTDADGASALDSPLDRFLSDDERAGLLRATEAEAGDLVLVVADEHRLACTVLGHLRLGLGGRPVGEGPYRYSGSSSSRCSTASTATATPWRPTTRSRCPIPTTWRCWPATRRPSVPRPTTSCSTAGSSAPAASGSTAATSSRQVFDALGISADEADARFGFLLGAFRHGAPPHAGFAFGIDRLVAILAGEENIREVIAFPKTQSGADPLTGAPKALAPAALADLGIRVAPRPEKG